MPFTTLKDAAQSALDVQNACNLSGVVASLHEVTTFLRQVEKLDTDACNRHPIVYLYVDKLADLCGVPHISAENVSAYGEMLAAVERMAQGGPLKTKDGTEIPDKVVQAIREAFPAKADSILAELRWHPGEGFFSFIMAGMFVGVELDGYIHT